MRKNLEREVEIETEDFNEQNPWHVFQWESIGKPDLEELDSNGKPWKPLAKKPENFILPEPDPLSQVKAVQKTSEQLAREALLECKSQAFLALVATGMSQEDANAAGTALIKQHSGAMWTYEFTGGNVDAKAALLAAIAENPPTWWSPIIASIFDETL